MYSTCLFCHSRLGENEAIEGFPVGTRLAFDSEKGRLWVVCRVCERWNLTPLEERWEAVEDCERRYRAESKRVTSDNIGLARLDEGLELVRVGTPLRPEFAAWRYGDQFGRRRRRTMVRGAGVGALAVAATFGGPVPTALAIGAWGLYAGFSRAFRLDGGSQVTRIPLIGGDDLTVAREQFRQARMIPDVEKDDGWKVEINHVRGRAVLAGPEAKNAIGLMLPVVNQGGAPLATVKRAVRTIENFADPERYLEAAAAAIDRRAPREKGLGKIPIHTRLALEMVAHEENERIAFEGDLALLEMDWKEAEEIAAIADNLVLPLEIEARLASLKTGRTSR